MVLEIEDVLLDQEWPHEVVPLLIVSSLFHKGCIFSLVSNVQGTRLQCNLARWLQHELLQFIPLAPDVLIQQPRRYFYNTEASKCKAETCFQ